MNFFEYPYVIITILAFFILLMGLFGLFFTMKSAKTAKGKAHKSFCGIGKIESDFAKAGSARKSRTLMYISLSQDALTRLHSASTAALIYDQVKNVLFFNLCLHTGGEISIHGKESFISLSYLEPESLEKEIENCFNEINAVLSKNDAINVMRIYFGYHTTSATDISFSTALDRAKQACSIAEDKDLLFCRWDSASSKEFERKIKIENSIQNEIDNNRFFLEYQPVIDAKTNKIIGAEVLSRLNSPTEGVLTPGTFLSALNNVGLNKKFDYYIFEKNCKWISSDPDKRKKYFYTINFSRFTLCDPSLADTVLGIIAEYGIDCSCIAVEILEDKSLTENEKTIMVKNLGRLKEKGVMILLDDFGKGYTSFGDLMDFDISIVKIDKSITQNAATSSGFVILKNIINTAHDLGFKTLCEGIETQEHKNIVIEAGCDILQGYFFYRPMPVSQLEALFDKQ